MSEKAILVGTGKKYTSDEEIIDSLNELKALLETAGGKTIAYLTQKLERSVSATVIGSGKVEELREHIIDREADLVVFDCELSPSQLRNLETKLDCKVLDRTQVILDIFALHAQTREGKLQVELAQLSYLLPRLIGLGKTLSRLGGGIGTRGPGETKLEVQRRRIRERISRLKKELEQVEKQRSVRRSLRIDRKVPIVSVAGYTNAGKSSLIKSLSKDENIYTKNALFATLNPVSRRIHIGQGKEIIMNDTVGFIKKLPHTIVEAFHATLEEIVFSDFIILLVDGNDTNPESKIEECQKVLKEIGADEINSAIVFNKEDLIDEEKVEKLKITYPDALFVSAKKGTGLNELSEYLYEKLMADR